MEQNKAEIEENVDDVRVCPLEVAVSRFMKSLGEEQPKLSSQLRRGTTFLEVINKYIDMTKTSIPQGILPDKYHGEFLNFGRVKNWGCIGVTRKFYNSSKETCLLKLPKALTNCKYDAPNYVCLCISRGINRLYDPAFPRNKDFEKEWTQLFVQIKKKRMMTFEVMDFSWGRVTSYAKHALSTPKLDGESVQISGVLIEDHGYWVVGSGEVHLIVRDESDLIRYEGRRRFDYVVEIARLWFTYVRKNWNVAHRMFEFMKKYILTANFILQDPNRCKYADHSSLESPRFVFITWTSRYKLKRFPTLDPTSSTAVAKGFGLETVECKTISFDSLRDYCDDIRKEHHRLGEVMYFFDINKNLTGLMKIYTFWYAVLKLIRRDAIALIRVMKKNNLEKKVTNFSDWNLNIADRDTRKEWLELAKKFIFWAADLAQTEIKVENGLREDFIKYWQRFLRETSSSDEIVFRHYPESSLNGWGR